MVKIPLTERSLMKLVFVKLVLGWGLVFNATLNKISVTWSDLLVEYTEKTADLPLSVTNFINNVVSSNKGILIADTCIYIHTTVYINLKNTHNSPNLTTHFFF
jgi:hypothetical protein